MMLKADEIGGGIARRTLTLAGERVAPGTRLTRAQVLSIKTSNRVAMLSSGFLEIFPRDPVRADAPAPIGEPAPDAVRYIVPVDGGYDVIVGQKLNAEPIKKVKDAQALANAPAAPTTTN